MEKIKENLNKVKEMIELILYSIVSSNIFKFVFVTIAYIFAYICCLFVTRIAVEWIGIDYDFSYGLCAFLILIYVDMKAS